MVSCAIACTDNVVIIDAVSRFKYFCFLPEIKETFHLFDMNHGGTLHFGDLECKLEDAGIEVEDSHIDHMMALIKKKGDLQTISIPFIFLMTGFSHLFPGHMINFFQYLAIVNNLANYIEKIAGWSFCVDKYFQVHFYTSFDTGKKISKQKIYDILVKFMKRSALSNLSFLRANAPQVLHPRLPHVLKHYLVGVTLEGLTERQLVKRMEEMTNPSPPRRPRSGSVSRRRARADASLERRRGHSGIARSSSDQICYVSYRQLQAKAKQGLLFIFDMKDCLYKGHFGKMVPKFCSELFLTPNP